MIDIACGESNWQNILIKVIGDLLENIWTEFHFHYFIFMNLKVNIICIFHGMNLLTW